MKRILTVVAAAALLLAACGPTATPTGPPSASPAPSAAGSSSPSGSPAPVTTPEAAAALVRAVDPRFAGIGPADPNLIGACCFYSVASAAGGWTVTIEIGWGDCPAGCINRHHWTYTVTTAGNVALASEDGPPVPAGVPGPGGGGGDGSGVIGIRGIATGGPVCPVVRPGDPNCADRPVVGATIHIIDSTGTEVALMETDATGAFVVTLPPGRYQVRADPVEGLMRPPAPVEVEVGSSLALVELGYDTGIR